RRVDDRLGENHTEPGEVLDCLRRAVPDDGLDASAQGAGGHSMTHRSDANHRHRPLRSCHWSPPCGGPFPARPRRLSAAPATPPLAVTLSRSVGALSPRSAARSRLAPDGRLSDQSFWRPLDAAAEQRVVWPTTRWV